MSYVTEKGEKRAEASAEKVSGWTAEVEGETAGKAADAGRG